MDPLNMYFLLKVGDLPFATLVYQKIFLVALWQTCQQRKFVFPSCSHRGGHSSARLREAAPPRMPTFLGSRILTLLGGVNRIPIYIQGEDNNILIHPPPQKTQSPICPPKNPSLYIYIYTYIYIYRYRDIVGTWWYKFRPKNTQVFHLNSVLRQDFFAAQSNVGLSPILVFP